MKNEFLKEPSVRKVTAVDITIDNHLGKFYTQTVEWANGEGFTFSSTDEKGNPTEVNLTWDEFDAVKKAAKIITKRRGA